jgi:signal transduction histidine kinase/ActR/RegA family two-component response regulator
MPRQDDDGRTGPVPPRAPEPPIEREFLRTDARVLTIIALALLARHVLLMVNDVLALDAARDTRLTMALLRGAVVPAYLWMLIIAHRATDRHRFERDLTAAVALGVVASMLWRTIKPEGFGPYFDAFIVVGAYAIFPLSARRLAWVLVPYSAAVLGTLGLSLRAVPAWDFTSSLGSFALANIVGITLARYRWQLLSGLRQSRRAQASLIATLEDERRNLEQVVQERTQALQRSNRELTAALRARSDFLGTMSHELRTPLTAILGLSEHLLTDPRRTLSTDQRGDLETILASGGHLLTLIDDMLLLTRSEQERLATTPSAVSMAELARDALRLVAPLASRYDVRLTDQLPADGMSITTDRRSLLQVLINLLTNAIKFTPAGGTVRLAVTLSEDREAAVFAVQDTGIGIRAEDIPRILQPFEQLDVPTPRERGGAGLGLAIVTRLVEALNGRLEIDSTPNVGSTFRVIITTPVAEARLAHGLTRSPAPEAGPGSRGRARVLVAEDHPTNQRLLQLILERAGYRCDIVHDGVEALAHCAVTPPDLLLVDIQMPRLDGLDVIARLRAAPATADLPIIAVSALAFPQDAERALAAGADGYLTKPIARGALLQLVTALLERSPDGVAATSPSPARTPAAPRSTHRSR